MFLNRVVQRREAHRIFAELPCKEMSMAEISGNHWARVISWKTRNTFEYPTYDICNGPFLDEGGKVQQFDVIVADQVWEHLDRPYAATKNVLAMLKPGGYFYVAVPFFIRFHAYPVDCSRWTSRGLSNLLIESGFDEKHIIADQWGNLRCSIPDDQIDPRRSALFMARSILRDVREGFGAC